MASDAEVAFSAGRWREARRLARADLGSSDEASRVAARALLARLRPDPVVVALVALSLLFFVLVAAGAVGR